MDQPRGATEGWHVMAISPVELTFLYAAHERGVLTRGGSILEFGEAETMRMDVALAL